MADLGIVPSPDSPYGELAGTGQGTLVRKQILRLNRQFINPKTGRPITLGEDAWRQMKANFDSRRVTDYVTFPLASEKNQHDERPERNAGLVTALEREGDAVFAVIDVRDPAVAEKIAGKRILGASAMLHLDATDPQSGERCGAALLHVAGTNRPALVDLAPYESVVAACGPAWTELPDGSALPPTTLMLCQSEVDVPPVMLADPEPDYLPEPDYYGGGMDEDYLRDEAARLGLLAYTESSGRGSKPEYGTIITDRDRQAALSAEAEITDTDILAATGELAEQYQVSFSAVAAAAHDGHRRSGLGHSIAERARVLGEVQVALSRGRLEVDDEQCVSLSQARRDGEDEILRLASDEDSEDMFGLAAHPSRAGKLLGTGDRAHAPAGEDISDTGQPGRGGRIHPEVARMFAKHRKEFGYNAEDSDVGTHGSESHAPKTPAQRHLEETYGLAGGRRGGRSIPELARGSARTRSGR